MLVHSCYDCGKKTSRISGQCLKCYKEEINNTPAFQAKLKDSEEFLEGLSL